MIKLIGLIKKVTDTGLIKPLPLTGIAKEWAKVVDSKHSFKGYLRFAPYVLGGLVIYGILWRGLPIDQALELLKVLF